MSLVTRCPRCRTLYQVLPAQLQAREGRVRCGRCRHVFDGFQALAVAQAGAAGEPERAEPERAKPGVLPAPSATIVSAFVEERPVDVLPAPGVAPLRVDLQAAPAEPAGPPKPSFSALLQARAAARREEMRERYLRRPSPNTVRILVCVGLAVLLAVQAIYAFRAQLAARYPDVKAMMLGICEVAGCTVPLPQRPDLLQKVGEDVSALDTARPGLIQVTVTLRSNATYAVAYPALDLVLTNLNEHALARRIFLPEEYLGGDPRGGIPPKAEITMALDLDTGDLNASGFRIDLLPAP